MVAPQILFKMEAFLGIAHLSFLCCGTVETYSLACVAGIRLAFLLCRGNLAEQLPSLKGLTFMLPPQACDLE